MSNYPKVSETSTPIDNVQWFAEKIGITNLDDLGAKVRTIINDVNESELARQKAKKVREAAAQDAFLDAMFNLDSGTAVLRQKKDRTATAQKVAKTAKKLAKPAKKIARVITVKQEPTLQQMAKVRRDAVIADLNAGKMIKVLPRSKKASGQKEYQKQRADLIYIKRNTNMTLIRLSRVGTKDSFFMIDNFERHEAVKLTGNLVGPDREPLIKALRSGKVFEVSNVTKGKKAVAASVTQLASRHGMDIFAVISSGRDLIGWIMPNDATKDTAPVKSNQESDIDDLGDMLDAMDYLRVEKEVAARMPTSTPDEILEAAYREFKRVAKDAGSTVSEVLAVKDGQ
ncbi:hypothetical protein [Psychrobacter sp. ASPA161_6]|uniref:hypothetical protein n=1 Tax=Psychrobacter sp. ASPA161_6 TaxID=3160962 RepID=UPI003F80EDE6